MKRSEFLKRLGLGVVVLPLVPKIAAEVAETIQEAVAQEEAKEYHLDHCVKLYRHYGENDIEEVMDIYRETGNLIYQQNVRPLRVNDLIHINSAENQYLIAEIHQDPISGNQIATCKPLEEGPDIFATQENNIIRFSNLKSEL